MRGKVPDPSMIECGSGITVGRCSDGPVRAGADTMHHVS
jgi:hypothetical protein